MGTTAQKRVVVVSIHTRCKTKYQELTNLFRGPARCNRHVYLSLFLCITFFWRYIHIYKVRRGHVTAKWEYFPISSKNVTTSQKEFTTSFKCIQYYLWWRVVVLCFKVCLVPCYKLSQKKNTGIIFCVTFTTTTKKNALYTKMNFHSFLLPFMTFVVVILLFVSVSFCVCVCWIFLSPFTFVLIFILFADLLFSFMCKYKSFKHGLFKCSFVSFTVPFFLLRVWNWKLYFIHSLS